MAESGMLLPVVPEVPHEPLVPDHEPRASVLYAIVGLPWNGRVVEPGAEPPFLTSLI